MAKIVKHKVTGLLGFVLRWDNDELDVVGEDGSYERYQVPPLELVGETDDITLPPSPVTAQGEPAQREVVASALAAIGKFKRGERE